MSNYPGALDDLSEQYAPDRSRPRFAAQQSVLIPQAIEAVQAELGVTPSAADATVSARLDRMEDDLEQAEMGALPSEIDCGTP